MEYPKETVDRIRTHLKPEEKQLLYRLARDFLITRKLWKLAVIWEQVRVVWLRQS